MRDRYFHNLVRSIMGQLGITVAEFDEFIGSSNTASVARKVYEKRSNNIKQLLSRMNPETLGRIAIYGRGSYNNSWKERVEPKSWWPQTTMLGVHTGDSSSSTTAWLDQYADGKTLLIEIACTTIVAEIAINLHNEALNTAPKRQKELPRNFHGVLAL